MRIYKCVVNVGGSLLNQVQKEVTAAEYKLLQLLHGNDAVNKVEPTKKQALSWYGPDADQEPDPDELRTNTQERARLQYTYGVALRRIPHVGNIDGVFGIGTVPLPQTIEGVDDIPLASEKPARRRKAPKAAPAPKAQDEDLSAMVG